MHKNRTDGIVAYLADLSSAYKVLNLPVDYYKKEAPIHLSMDAFVCHNTKFNKEKINEINKRIKELSTSGKLNSLLKSAKEL